MDIKEAKDLATLPLDELIGNLKVYEMILENDGVTSKTTKEKVYEEEAKAFNVMARNFQNFRNKGGESSRQKRGCYNCGEEGHFIGEFPKPKENKAFVGRAWSDSEDSDEPQNDATCLMAVDSQEPKSSPLVEDDRINELIVQDSIRPPSLEANASELGYPKSVKEARGHPIEQFICELNERKLRSKIKQA
ncbi:zf-CCHC domain-containing protein [Tanacetum coccineum]